MHKPYYLKDLPLQGTLHLGLFELFYLADMKNQTMNVHRSNVIRFYPHRERDIVSYLQATPVSPTNKEAIIKWLDSTIAERK